MKAMRRLFLALTRPWKSGGVWAAEVLDGQGTGLGRLVLAACCLGLALLWQGNREYTRYVEQTPAVLAQLPRLGLRNGQLWTDPPQVEPLLVKDSAGHPLLLLDLEARLRLEDQAAPLQLTRTRLRFKGGDGQVQEVPLASPGQADGEVKPAELLAFLRGPARWLALFIASPFLLALSLGMIFLEQAVLSLMILVPNRLYGTRLAFAARLRLISLAVLASTQLSVLALLLGLALSPGWLLPLGLSLAALLRGVLAVQAEQATRPRLEGGGRG